MKFNKLAMIEPSCPQGYTEYDISLIMNDRLSDFNYWMRGQTGSICDGRRYDHGKREYQATECSGMFPGMQLADDEVPGGHGYITYPSDVERFLRGLPVID